MCWWSHAASALQQLEAGFQPLPVTEVGSQQWEYQILATRPLVSDKAVALRLCGKRIPARTESSETSTVFIRKKKKQSTVLVRVGSERVAPSWQFKSLIWGISSGFLWPIILICLVQSPYLVYLRVLPCAHASLSQDGFYSRGLWVISITYYGVVPTPFLTSKELFCTCVVGEVSWLRE